MRETRLETEPQTVGVIGGGQLCRMLCEAVSPLGLEVVFVDPTPDAPANHVARDQIVGGFDDADAVERLAERADVLTYDIELADPDVVESAAEDAGVPVHPHPDTLRTIQDKYVQKEALTEEGVPVPAYRAVETVEDLRAAADELGLPLMLKAREGGYDGRGNVPVETEDDFEDALGAVEGKVMVEEFIDYDRELSVIAAQGDGEEAFFPVTETVHREEILRRTVTPARTDEKTRERAREVAREVLNVMEGRGVYGIEMFEDDGKILVNEIAPRPHNSGHWTIEGARTSQFEQHARGVVGAPLGSTELRAPTVSVNILGDGGPRDVSLAGVEELLASDAHLHWYGKKEERPLRKLGHFTLTGDGDADGGTDELLREADDVQDELRFEK
ncbi:MAG: 5-(carboxyamino)imidazole ribonucleotide synthase [Halobacteriales archaeon]|nr:5-(carboxyamino)imidazole ribonucleotide synthase [Halobacteriales archaeon]